MKQDIYTFPKKTIQDIDCELQNADKELIEFYVPRHIEDSTHHNYNQDYLQQTFNRITPNKNQKQVVCDQIVRTGQFEPIHVEWYLVPPNSVFHQRWDLFIILLVLYNIIVMPLEICLNIDSFSTSLTVFKYFIDFCFFLDILITFFTPLKKENGELDVNIKNIALDYIKGRFIIEILATIPYDAMSSFLPDLSFNLLVLKFLKVARLFRIGRVLKYIENMRYVNFFKILKLFAVLMLFAHWVGCILYLFEDYNIQNPENPDETLLFDSYVNCLLSAAFLVVGNDIEPSDDLQRLFCLVAINVGQAVTAYVFGNMTVLIQNMDQSESKYRDKLDIINEYMRYTQIPEDLMEEIHIYYEYLWMRQRTLIHDIDLCSDLSRGLKKQLLICQYRPFLKNVQLLQKVSPTLVEELILHLKQKLLLPDTLVMIEGDVGKDMYFISKGTLHVYMGGQFVRVLKDGDYFGEIALLTKAGIRTATIVTQTYSDFFYIDKCDFDRILMDNSLDAEIIQNQAKVRFYDNYDMIPAEVENRLYYTSDGLKHKTIWRVFSENNLQIAHLIAEEQEKLLAEKEQKFQEPQKNQVNINQSINLQETQQRKIKKTDYGAIQRITENYFNYYLTENNKKFEELVSNLKSGIQTRTTLSKYLLTHLSSSN